MEQKVYDLLNELSIEFEVVQHPPLFTCDDNDKYNVNLLDGVNCKNLFIRNKDKSQYYLVSLPVSDVAKRLDLKNLQEELGESKLSFGNEIALGEKLSIKTGAVSIFNIVNSPETDVIFLLDKEILNYDKICFHPNVNTATIVLSPNEIEKILKYCSVEYKFIKL